MRIGIVGCGRMGKRHAQYYRNLSDVEVAGCHDADDSAAQGLGREYGAQVYAELDGLLDARPDAISVCTPPSSHVAAVLASIERGIPVLCEKPLARRVQECECIPADGPLACAFKFRHLPGAVPLRDLIARGDLGRIVSIRGTAVSNLDMSRSWFSDPEVAGGGVLLDNGVHLIDLCRFLVGPVDSVVAVVPGNTRRLRVEESASVLMRMAGGAAAHLFMSWEAPAPMPPLIEVQGSAGYARLGYELEVFDSAGKERILHIRPDGVDIWREVLANFVEYARGRAQSSATFEDGYAALAAAEAAYRSVETGKWEQPMEFNETIQCSPRLDGCCDGVGVVSPA